MKLVVVSNNPHKLDEIKAIFQESPIQVLSYKKIFKDIIEVVENGNTFEENAIKKADAFPATENIIFLAEDSGLEVNYLNGGPGIYSARYAGKGASKETMCQKLLKDMYGAGDRSARYCAVMALKFPDGCIKTVTGIVNGHIDHDMQGNNGFGYDPVFIPDSHDQSFGQLPITLKHKISHRFRALEKVALILKDYP